MLPAIVVILFFTGALVAALTLFVAYAVEEHSKRDLKGYIFAVRLLVGIGGAICAWQTIEVVNRGFMPLNF